MKNKKKLTAVLMDLNSIRSPYKPIIKEISIEEELGDNKEYYLKIVLKPSTDRYELFQLEKYVNEFGYNIAKYYTTNKNGEVREV